MLHRTTIIDQRMSDALIYLIPCIRAQKLERLRRVTIIVHSLPRSYRCTSFQQSPDSPKDSRMVPAVKLRVFNIVVKTPSGNFRVLQALEDYSDINMHLDPKDNKELPHRINLFYNDTCNVRVWQEVMVDHILSDILIGVQTPN